MCMYIHAHMQILDFIHSFKWVLSKTFFFNKQETTNFYLKPPFLIECEFSNNFFSSLPRKTDKISKFTIS